MTTTTTTGLAGDTVYYLPDTLPSKSLFQSAVKHWMDALLEFNRRLISYTSPCRNDVYQNFKCHDIASYLLWIIMELNFMFSSAAHKLLAVAMLYNSV